MLQRLPGWVVDNDSSVRAEVAEWANMTPSERWKLAQMCARDALWALEAGGNALRSLESVDPLPESTVAALGRLRREAGWGHGGH